MNKTKKCRGLAYRQSHKELDGRGAVYSVVKGLIPAADSLLELDEPKSVRRLVHRQSNKGLERKRRGLLPL